MSFVNRQLYKQKPQAYGPLSVVQASIFKNAERMGIDPSKLSGVFPFWEGAGSVVRSAINNGYFTSINHSWGNNSLDLTAANSKATYTGNIFNKRILGTDPVTIFYRITNTNRAQTNTYVQQHGSNTLALIYGYVDNTYETYGWGGRKTIGVMSADDVGKDVSLGVSWDGLTGNYDTIYNRTIAFGTATFNIVNSSSFMLFSAGTTGYFAGKLNFGIISVEKWASNTLLSLDDNPYFLLHRAPPVFYSVPGGGVIIKNITDSCLGTDSIAQISNFFSVSDAGTGADGFAGLTAGLSVVDAGSGVDTVKPIASLTVQDTGSAIDLIQQISAVCSVADTGAGIDSVGQLLASMIVSDAGSGADVITVLKELLKTVTDSGTGTDSISRILASLSVSDTGSSTDTISQIIAGVSVSDDGSGADFINLLKDILKTISDTGSGTDSVSIQPVSVSVQDAGTALDMIGHIAVALSVSDAGTIAEIISTIKTKMVTVTDTGTGSDSAPTISVSLTVSDTAAALDLVGQVINSLTVSDTGTGLESITKTDFDLLPSGKVTVTFTIKTPGASFAMRTPKATFNIE